MLDGPTDIYSEMGTSVNFGKKSKQKQDKSIICQYYIEFEIKNERLFFLCFHTDNSWRHDFCPILVNTISQARLLMVKIVT